MSDPKALTPKQLDPNKRHLHRYLQYCTATGQYPNGKDYLTLLSYVCTSTEGRKQTIVEGLPIILLCIPSKDHLATAREAAAVLEYELRGRGEWCFVEVSVEVDEEVEL